MHPWLARFLQGFHFQVNYGALRYLVVCAAALTGAILGAYLSGGDVTWVVLSGAGFYLAGLLALRVLDR